MNVPKDACVEEGISNERPVALFAHEIGYLLPSSHNSLLQKNSGQKTLASEKLAGPL